MKHLIAGILVIFISYTAQAEETRCIQFDGVKYFLTSEEGNDREHLREYLPAGQQIAEWNELVSVRTIKGLTDAKAYAANLQKGVLRSSPLAQCIVAEKNKVIVVDFLMFPADMSYGEFNMMKVVSSTAGLTVFQFAKKWRGDDWGAKLKAERMRLYDVIYNATFTEEGGSNRTVEIMPHF